MKDKRIYDNIVNNNNNKSKNSIKNNFNNFEKKDEFVENEEMPYVPKFICTDKTIKYDRNNENYFQIKILKIII